ncbi:MAG: uncharacterized protein PWP07_2397 [Epulopiscium sp.]|nr:putative nucleotidyltransferase [Clostridia bacterium]MDK2789152.1 uncharacterized protein [Candidatus Epulonipiscium sp.]
MRDKHELINEIKERLLSQISPISILLFGSIAKGKDTDDSDIDLLVVWDEQKDLPNVKRRIMLRKLIGIIDSPVDILTCNLSELENALAEQNSFTAQIVKEGELLYGRLDGLQ